MLIFVSFSGRSFPFLAGISEKLNHVKLFYFLDCGRLANSHVKLFFSFFLSNIILISIYIYRYCELGLSWDEYPFESRKSRDDGGLQVCNEILQ